MKATSIFKFIGILFVIIGFVVGITVMAGGRVMGTNGETVLFGLLFLVIFGGIGGFFAVLGFRMDAEDRKILREGDVYMGKILDYRPDHRVTINGAPALALVVRYFAKGQICEAVVNTGEADRTGYPLGSTVSIRIYQGKCALVPGSVSDISLEQEADLLNPDYDPNVNVSSVGVTCPGCGAAVTVPYGMSRVCPYCERKLTVNAEGRLLSRCRSEVGD